MQKEDSGIGILRIGVAILLGIHGVTRIVIGGVVPFGEFLNLKGFPMGRGLAWAITGFEIVAALLLLMGQFIIPTSLLFIIELTMGIVLVHASEGWFVVGAGRNGVEYSVLLIVSLFALIVSTRNRARRKEGE